MQYAQIISLLLKCLASSSQKNPICYCDSWLAIGDRSYLQKKKKKEKSPETINPPQIQTVLI